MSFLRDPYVIYKALPPYDWEQVEQFAADHHTDSERLHLECHMQDPLLAGSLLIALASTLPEVPLDINEINLRVNPFGFMDALPAFDSPKTTQNFAHEVRDMTGLDIDYDPVTHVVSLSLSHENAHKLLDVKHVHETEIARNNLASLSRQPLDPYTEMSIKAGANTVRVLAEEAADSPTQRELLKESILNDIHSALADRNLMPTMRGTPQERSITREAAQKKLESQCGQAIEAAIAACIEGCKTDPDAAEEAFKTQYRQILTSLIGHELKHGRYSRSDSTTGFSGR